MEIAYSDLKQVGSMYVCMCVCIIACMYIHILSTCMYMYVCICMYVYLSMYSLYVCVYVCICVYVCTGSGREASFVL